MQLHTSFISISLLAVALGLGLTSSEVGAESRPATQFLQQTGDLPSVSRQVSLMSTLVEFEILLPPPVVGVTGVGATNKSQADQDSERARAEAEIDLAIAEFERITALMSDWIPDTQVSRLNGNAGSGQWLPISTELYRLLSIAREVAWLSDGAFDISFRSAGDLWDFRRAQVPTAEEIEQAIEHIDYRKLELQAAEKNRSAMARITDAETQIGLGAIAKGYAIDRAVQIFREAGYQAFAVNAGGDLYVAGRHGERLWNVGIQHPRDAERLLANLPASNLAVATSGDYERFFIKDGVRFSHIINPQTGYPANGCQSVTGISARAYWADALATAVSVLGPEKGMALIEKLDGVETLIVDAEGEVQMSAGFQRTSGMNETAD